LLREWRIHFRVIGAEVSFSGALDENLIPVLHRLPQPTFVTLDRDFHRSHLAHGRYCLAWLDVRNRLAADFIRRFLRHPLFDTQAKRMGVVARVHPDGIEFWQTDRRSLLSAPWPAA